MNLMVDYCTCSLSKAVSRADAFKNVGGNKVSEVEKLIK